MASAMAQFYNMIWEGMKTVIFPIGSVNISAASLLLGIFVVDISLGILFSVIRFYGSVGHAVTRTGRSVLRRVRK